VTRHELEAKLRSIFARVFAVAEDAVGPAFEQGTTREWDSLRHLGLITSIEDELGIRFDERDAVELLSFELAVTIAAEKLGI
jgi:acyl carrier protein